MAAVLSAQVAFGAIDGTIINKTSGAAVANATVTLVKPGQGGMRTLGTVKTDASGHFQFDKDEPGGGPQLLQTVFEGVTYTKLMPPGSPASGVEFGVFAVSKAPGGVQIAQQFMVIEPDASKISIGETVMFQNSSSSTFSNPQTGSYRFYLPRAANGQVKVQVETSQGMPLPRAAEKTEEADVFKVDYPIKPGETQFEINYTIPAGTPFTFRGRVVDIKGMTAGPLRLIAPSGVTLTGADVQNVGVEPKTQATIYNVLKPSFSFDIAGTGSLRPPEVDTSGGGAADGDTPSVVQGAPKIYQHLGWLVGIAFGILAVGLIVLYRTSPVRTPYGS